MNKKIDFNTLLDALNSSITKSFTDAGLEPPLELPEILEQAIAIQVGLGVLNADLPEHLKFPEASGLSA